MLANFSNEELDRSARALAAHEKHDIARFIAHIAVIGKRGYDIDLGYHSLFDYCVRRFNLSEGSVYRRTQVAGVCRKFPAILEAISQGRLHLTGASLIAPHLTHENVERLIAEAQGKTKREVENLLVALAPKEPFAPSIRRQPVSDPATEPQAPGALLQEHPEGGAPEAPPRRNLLQPATEERYNVRFSVGVEFTEKLSRLAEVLGIECPRNHMEEILTRALEIALEKKDPQRKLERRREREERRNETCPGKAQMSRGSCSSEEETRDGAQAPSTDQANPAPSRLVPAEVRERVLERAGYQCQYRGPDGTRCSSRTGLQVEHTRSFAIYRTHEEKHLRAFCPAHNRCAARRFYGPEFIERKIAAARDQNVKRCEASALP
jgi:5-methylcytosine-specific restriction endonuclease McrA